MAFDSRHERPLERSYTIAAQLKSYRAARTVATIGRLITAFLAAAHYDSEAGWRNDYAPRSGWFRLFSVFAAAERRTPRHSHVPCTPHLRLATGGFHSALI